MSKPSLCDEIPVTILHINGSRSVDLARIKTLTRQDCKNTLRQNYQTSLSSLTDSDSSILSLTSQASSSRDDGSFHIKKIKRHKLNLPQNVNTMSVIKFNKLNQTPAQVEVSSLLSVWIRISAKRFLLIPSFLILQ